MKRISITLGGGLALLLTGCAVVGPDFQRPATPAPAAWKVTINSSTKSLATDWWKMFHDETLNDLERRALAANQDLRKAIARVDETRANLGVAKSANYPSVNLDPAAERSRSSANGPQSVGTTKLEQTRFRAPLDAGYELDLWGRVKRSIESSQAQAEAMEAARDTVTLNLTAELAENYFNLRALDSEIQILQRTLTLRQNVLAVNQTRLDKGLALPADVSRAETELANVQSDLSDVRRRRTLFENALALLSGEAASAFVIEAKSDAPAAPPAIPAGLPSELLLRRPDVADAERTAASKSAEIGVAKAAFLPTFKLTGAAGFESAELKDLFAWESRIWSFGPSVTLPIFSGGKNRANLQAAEARYEQAVAAYRQSVLAAFRDVESALVNLRQYSEQEKALRRAADSARRTAGYYDQRLQGGMIGYLDVVDAQRTFLQAERAAVQNLGSRYTTTVQLIKALGGGWARQE
jgi:multidrug efflux system outer membrane protein